MFDSKQYWENRYKSKFTSGAGSYGVLSDYKAKILNEFIEANNINSIIDWGSGDGNQVALLKCKKYLGLDVSITAVNLCLDKFKSDTTKNFILNDQYDGTKFDLAISLDVIFHLIEDEVFEQYMITLFNSSNKYVIVYSSNGENLINKTAEHFKDRNFTNWIETNISDFQLLAKLENPYKFDIIDPDFQNKSVSDFYIYEKIIPMSKI